MNSLNSVEPTGATKNVTLSWSHMYIAPVAHAYNLSYSEDRN
jgi:hypothetical protein